MINEVLYMEITLKIDNIDYDSATEMMMPMLMDHFANDKDNVMARLLMLSQGVTESAVKAILSRMTQEQKDQLLVRLTNSYKPQIKKLLTQMAASQGIRLTIKDVEAKME